MLHRIGKMKAMTSSLGVRYGESGKGGRKRPSPSLKPCAGV